MQVVVVVRLLAGQSSLRFAPLRPRTVGFAFARAGFFDAPGFWQLRDGGAPGLATSLSAMSIPNSPASDASLAASCFWRERTSAKGTGVEFISYWPLRKIKSTPVLSLVLSLFFTLATGDIGTIQVT